MNQPCCDTIMYQDPSRFSCYIMHYSYLTSVTKLIEGDQARHVHIFPDFVWLLRDVDCIPRNADGKEVSPTDYLTSVLQRNKSYSASSTLLSNFPSFKCLTIPPPSTDSSILSDITGNVGRLSPLFNEEVDSSIQWLLNNVRAKVGGISGLKCEGQMLACLLEQYFTQISESSGIIRNFHATWLTAIELRLKKMADSLVNEYNREMQAGLEGKLPMVEGTDGETGDTLMNTHLLGVCKEEMSVTERNLVIDSPQVVTAFVP